MNKKKKTLESLTDSETSQTITLAGITLECDFCEKLNDQPYKLALTSEPIVNITKDYNSDLPSYIVNVVAYIPSLSEDAPIQEGSSGLQLLDGKLFLNYAGVDIIGTEMDEEPILCRVFHIAYDQTEVADTYDVYHIQFKYRLLNDNFQSVKGIIVHNVDIDPKTDRGTVTTVRIDKR